MLVAAILDLGAVPVRGREDHYRGSDRVRLAMPGIAPPAMIMPAFAEALALAACSLESDAKADLPPVCGIA